VGGQRGTEPAQTQQPRPRAKVRASMDRDRWTSSAHFVVSVRMCEDVDPADVASTSVWPAGAMRGLVAQKRRSAIACVTASSITI
jgi:hypothetical protein